MPDGKRRKRKAVTFSDTAGAAQEEKAKKERYVPRFSAKRTRVSPCTRSASRAAGSVEGFAVLGSSEGEETAAVEQLNSGSVSNHAPQGPATSKQVQYCSMGVSGVLLCKIFIIIILCYKLRNKL